MQRLANLAELRLLATPQSENLEQSYDYVTSFVASSAQAGEVMAITGFKCGRCGAIFADPDVCMIHFIQNHPKENEDEEEK